MVVFISSKCNATSPGGSTSLQPYRPAGKGMEVGDMLNARHAAAADAQLRQQMHQAARLDVRNSYALNTNHATVGHNRSIPPDTSHLGYPSLNQSSPTQQMTPDSFMMGQSQPDSEDISNGNDTRQPGESAPKSFGCSTCAKRFARRSDLARHGKGNSFHSVG